MSGVRVRVDVDDRELRQRLKHLADLRVPRAVWAAVGQTLATSTVARFEAGRGPDGQPWEPSRRAGREGGRTLVDTARLRGSITYRASDDGVEVGTNVVYAAIHQLGSAPGGGRPRGIPARPYLGVDDDDRTAIVDAILSGLERRLAS